MPGYTIPAGELTERVTIQRRDTAVDGLGQGATTWVDVDTVWARVRVLSARDFQAAEQAQASTAIRVEIRIGLAVTSAMRVWWDGRAWDIVGEPMPIDRTWLRIDAQSGVRDAR